PGRVGRRSMNQLPRISGKDLIEVLQRGGFEISRTRGSHYYLKKPGESGIVVVPVHGNHALPAGTLGLKLRQAGLSVEEFSKLVQG
ncbi:MAG: type II toxin-antitoxin system HicA family toxin, partial [Chloroflexi bacterium]|nr:type II toxin-antitoxin system HicA family toxin [Chloroflexota bacterium]